MNLQVFLLLFLFMLSLAPLCHFTGPIMAPPHSRAHEVRITVQRLLKHAPPRLSSCRLDPPSLSGWGHASACPTLAWDEKPLGARTGEQQRAWLSEPKMASTPASLTLTCMLVVGTWHATGWLCIVRADPDLSLSACQPLFSARRHTPLVPFAPTSQQSGECCLCSLWLTFRRSTGLRYDEADHLHNWLIARARTHRPCTSARSRHSHSRTSQLDELRTRLPTPHTYDGCGLAIDPQRWTIVLPGSDSAAPSGGVS